MTTWGYARVSKVDQHTAPQFDALRAAGIREEHIVVDHASGSKANRPGLMQLMQDLAEGDVLTVWKLDRLGRSVSHLLHLVDELGRRGVEFRSLTDHLDTTTPGGKMLFTVMASVAEFEREMARERTIAALASVRDQGKPLGRPSMVNEHQYRMIHRMNAAGVKHGRIAATTGLSRAVVGRVTRGEIASLEARFQKTSIADTDDLPFYEEA